MAFLHTCDCSNVPGASGPGVPLCTIVPRDLHFKKKKKKSLGFDCSPLLSSSSEAKCNTKRVRVITASGSHLYCLLVWVGGWSREMTILLVRFHHSPHC